MRAILAIQKCLRNLWRYRLDGCIDLNTVVDATEELQREQICIHKTVDSSLSIATAKCMTS